MHSIICTGSPTVPVVQISSEQFGMNNVTVILEWINEGGGVSYNASVTPECPQIEMFTGNGTQGIKLVLLYNTQYNLSTVATLCEENSAASITELNYGEFFFAIWSVHICSGIECSYTVLNDLQSCMHAWTHTHIYIYIYL